MLGQGSWFDRGFLERGDIVENTPVMGGHRVAFVAGGPIRGVGSCILRVTTKI